jgi:hypothetical protein
MVGHLCFMSIAPILAYVATAEIDGAMDLSIAGCGDVPF